MKNPLKAPFRAIWHAVSCTTSKLNYLLRHEGFMKYSKNTGWMFFGQSTMVISLLINIWIARNLGAANFGTLSYIFAFVGIFSFIANLGISDILTRDLVRTPSDTNKLMGTSFRLLSYGGIAAFLACSISILFLETNPVVKTLVIVYSTIFLWSPVNVIAAYFQATVQAKKNAQAQMIGVLLTSCLKIFLLATNKGMIWLTVAFALDYVIGTILYIWNYLHSDLTFKLWIYDTAIAKKFFYSSVLLMLSSAAGYILLKIDQVMIKFYMNEASVGLYAVAVKLSEIWYFIPAIICASVFPAIINSKKTDALQYKSRLSHLYIFLGVSAVLIALPISLFASQIITLLFGAAYTSSAPILQIYVWSGVGLFLMTGINRYFMTEDRLNSIFYYSLLSVVMNVVLNIVLIPKIGLLGAAWATLVSYLISPIMVFILGYVKQAKS